MQYHIDQRPVRSTSSGPLRLILATAILWLPLLLFVLLAAAIRSDKPLLGEATILRDIHDFSQPTLDKLVELLTHLGSASVVVPGVVLASALLAYKRYRSQALFLLVCGGGTSVINVVFKLIFRRDRPELWQRLVTESSYSFPSGHAMISSTLALAALYLLWQVVNQRLLVAVCAAYVVVVGFTRLYLGVHYPSDIIAGWCVSLLWVSVVVLVFKRYGWNYQLSKSPPTSK